MKSYIVAKELKMSAVTKDDWLEVANLFARTPGYLDADFEKRYCLDVVDGFDALLRREKGRTRSKGWKMIFCFLAICSIIVSMLLLSKGLLRWGRVLLIQSLVLGFIWLALSFGHNSDSE